MRLVTNRIEKWFASLGFTLRRAYWKMSTAKPSIVIVATIVAAFSLFLLAGGIYDILEPMGPIPWGRGVLFFYPHLQGQIPYESVGVMAAYAMGAAGILLMYQSTKYAYKPRQAFMMLLSGVVLILIAYIYSESLLLSKLFPPQATQEQTAG